MEQARQAAETIVPEPAERQILLESMDINSDESKQIIEYNLKLDKAESLQRNNEEQGKRVLKEHEMNIQIDIYDSSSYWEIMLLNLTDPRLSTETKDSVPLTGALTTATLPVDAPPVDGAVAMEGDVLSTVLPTDTEIDSIALATSLEDIEAAKTILETAYTLSAESVQSLTILARLVCVGEENMTPFRIYETGVQMEDAEMIMSSMDKDQDGQVSLEDFLHQDPILEEEREEIITDPNVVDEGEQGEQGDPATSGESTEEEQKEKDSESKDDSVLLEIPPSASTTYVAAGYSIALLYLIAFGCICFSCNACVKQTTVVLFFISFLLTFVVVHNNTTFCHDKDLITCMSTSFFSNSIVTILLVAVYILIMYFSQGTIFWNILALPLGVITSGVTVAGGCGSLLTTVMGPSGGGRSIPPVCDQLNAFGETIFFCTGDRCTSIPSRMPVAPTAIFTVIMWVSSICVMTYYLTQEDEENNGNTNGSDGGMAVKEERKKVRRLSTQLETKNKEIEQLKRTQQSQQQNVPGGAGGWGPPGGGPGSGPGSNNMNNMNNNNNNNNNNNSSNAQDAETIRQLRTSMTTLEEKYQTAQQQADNSGYRLEQMQLSMSSIENEKNNFEILLDEARNKYTKTSTALQQIVTRFDDLKKQNVSLQMKLRQVKEKLLGNGNGNDDGLYPDTPSAF